MRRFSRRDYFRALAALWLDSRLMPPRYRRMIPGLLQTATAFIFLASCELALASQSPYRRLVFFDDFTSTDTIDVLGVKTTGPHWYREQWWGNGVTSLDSISQSGTVLTLGAGTGRGRLQSAIAADTPQKYLGNVWSGGAYFEVRMRFDPRLVGHMKGNFGIYLFSIEHIYDDAASGDARWPGQINGYGHFCELDMFEFAGSSADRTYNGKASFQGTIHDWSGTHDITYGWQHNISNSNSLQKVDEVNWDEFHTYGVLWIPQRGSKPGSVQWFFDDTPLGKVYWLGPPGSPPLRGRHLPTLPPRSSRTGLRMPVAYSRSLTASIWRWSSTATRPFRCMSIG